MFCESDDEDKKFDTVQSGWNHTDEKKFDPAPGWNIEQPKFNPSQSTRSEEIVVVSDVNFTKIFIVTLKFESVMNGTINFKHSSGLFC